jgi:hypothetical protein
LRIPSDKVVSIAALLLAFEALVVPGEVEKARPIAAEPLSSPEVFRLLIPDYDERMRRWDESAGTDNEAWDRFDVRVSESCETDFGLGGKRYQVVSLEGETGACTQCYLLVVGVLDPATKEVLWRFGGESIGGPAGISLRRVLPGPNALSLAFRHWEGSTNWGAVTTETWIQPALDPSGSLSFREIWSGTIEAQNAGNLGGGREIGCGWIEPADRPEEFLFRQSVFYADSLPCDFNADPNSGSLTCPARIPEERMCSAVEIAKVQRWSVDRHGLKRVSSRSRRLDHGKSGVFPFDLAVRSVFLRPTGKSVPVYVYPKETRVLSSPDKASVLQFETCCDRKELSLFRKGRHLRSVLLKQGDLFDGSAEALGWASDSRRFFVVVKFGFSGERALLSFSEKGQDDYWEALLTDDPSEWKDGFIMEPAKRVARKGGSHPGNK